MSSSSARLYGTTGTSFVRLDEDAQGWTSTHALPDSGAQCLALDPADADVVYVGHVSGGLSKTTDAGDTWSDRMLAAHDVFSVAVSAADGALYVGTEPSALYRSDDGGKTWTELEGLLALPSQPTWSFPPRPWTSHVRWIAPSPHDAGVLLAGIELGGLMRSTDRGETWQDHRQGAQRDVHSLAWHPHVVGRAYEAGGGGAAWSDDAGDTWHAADDGRDRHYTWSVAVDPEDPDLWYVSASTGPFAAHGRGDPQAHVYRLRNGGWDRLAGGLPEPLPSMPYALVATEGRLFAGLASGELWESRDRGDTWRKCALEAGLTRLQALVAVPG
jgi:BNR/Asp-box repeat protein